MAKTVLIVEDEQSMQRALKNKLEHAGYTVIPANDAAPPTRFRLEYSSFPVAASNAYSVARVPLFGRSFENSPADNANTTPLAMTGGSGEFISRETHAAVRTIFPD